MSITVDSDQRAAILENFYEPGAHAGSHAQEVAQDSLRAAAEPEYANSNFSELDLACLEIAALFHDVGYKRVVGEHHRGTKEEHSFYSVRIFLDYCKETGFLSGNPEALSLISWLIFNHDNSQYRFGAVPFFEREYFSRRVAFTNPAGSDLEPGTLRKLPESLRTGLPFTEEIPENQVHLLQALQEADGLTGTAKRTIDFNISRGIPLTVPENTHTKGIGLLAYQASALASAYVATLRGLLDTVTETGFDRAVQLYDTNLAMINAVLIEANPGVSPEKVFAPLSREQITRIYDSRKDAGVRWRDYSWSDQSLTIPQWFQPQLLHSQVNAGVHAKSRLNMISSPATYQPVGSELVSLEKLTIPWGAGKLQGLVDDNLAFADQVLFQYGIDVFTQIHGGFLAEMLDKKVTEPSNVSSGFFLPPIATEQHSDFPISSKRVLAGYNWVAAAREQGRTEIRVLLAELNGHGFGNYWR